MKKIYLYFLLFLSIISLTGCETVEEKDPNAPANLREITGEIVRADVEGEYILIAEKDITEEVRYISYEYENVTIGLLAVRNKEGKVIVVINTCQSCGGAPYAYFVQVGDKIQCQNCGNYFAIDELDSLEEDGCNPIAVRERIDEDGVIKIGVEQLKELKDTFANWKGPKV